MKIISQLASAPRLVSTALGAAALVLGACSQTPVTVTLHSLQASGNLSFVCQADDGSGLKLDECPDYENAHRRILGLVTQTATKEVAIVDLRGGAVVDVDPSTPGYTFLRVGATPGAIVSSPGGAASFVGVTGVQKNGIFALPTTCLRPPAVGEPTRDLTTWAACSLSSAPGDIKLVIDPTGTDVGTPRAACGGTPEPPPPSPHECAADLTAEGGPPGRRKLIVALPEEHKLVLLDAQTLLDRPAGEFQACTVEATYPLSAALPTGPVASALPSDLQVTDPGTCQTTPAQFPGVTATLPKPAGLALSGSTLYVADAALPLVHVLDLSDPCAPREHEPLLPHSYLDPNRVVTTSRVAVSPLTPTGKQYVYAVDVSDQPAASIMVFDVTGGIKNLPPEQRTPVVFPGAPRQPFTPPDRLQFSADVKDVGFVMRDFPNPDPTTGVGQFGLTCDPDPRDTGSPAALYQPNTDATAGARPFNLRGVFGFAMLTNGQIPVIDVEDFDAPCRRPVIVNGSSTVDFRGCPPDPEPFRFYTQPLTPDAEPAINGVPTVTNELSCNIVEPNRARSQYLAASNATVGLRGPSLRALPQFSNPDPSAVVMPHDTPQLLAVDFPTDAAGSRVPAQVNVSGQLYAACPSGSDGPSPPPCGDLAPQVLDIDPATATQNSLTLPLVEPRSYIQDESPTLTFEGRLPLLSLRTSGFLQQLPDGQWSLQDPDAVYCSSGVEDSQAILTEASELQIPAANQPAWAAAHADYVQITADFLDPNDVYWSKGNGATCGAGSAGSTLVGRDACVAEFGPIDNVTSLNGTRELSIVSAFSDHLIVQSRNGNDIADVKCCFPSGTAYTVRASQQWVLSAASGPHDIGVGDGGRCVHTAACDPRKKYFRSRAFEVCDPSVTVSNGGAGDVCTPGNVNVGCVRSMSGPVRPVGTDAGSPCIFENLTSRFVVYRGASVSVRDMSFNWSTTGGFVPLAMSLSTVSTQVNPQSMAYIPELGYLAVVDGSTLGLSLFDLNSLGVVSPSPYF